MSVPTKQPAVNLKHRITGAVILALMALGFVGVVIKDPKPRLQPQSVSSTPQAPVPTPVDPFTSRIVGSDGSAPEEPSAARRSLQLQPVLEPDMRLPVLPRLNTVPTSPQPDDAAPAARIRKTVATKSAADPVAERWLVRVASFAEQVNADQAVSQLREAGYEPGSAEVRIAGKSMVRVWVGPFDDRLKALRAKADIAERLGLDGFIRRQE